MIYIIIATTKGRRARLQECVDAIKASVTTQPYCIVTYENSDGGCVLATKKALSGINGTIFILNDDMIIEPDCIEKLYNAYDQDRTCIYQPWESMHQGNLAVAPFGHTLMIKPFLDKGYIHNYWDTELTVTMQSIGKYRPIMDAKMDHRHVSRNPDLMDETYKVSQATFMRDQELFNSKFNKSN